MAKKKKKRVGYRKPIPENIKVVPVKKKIKDDYEFDFGTEFSHEETRFAIIDADTDEVFDDAQGYGYKTAQAAYKAFGYKKQTDNQRKAYEAKKDAIAAFCRKHQNTIDIICEEMVRNHGLSDEEISKYFSDEEKAEMTFTIKELVKYW